ncbi:MCE family protein [Pseudonocardia spinosispora]|uniref:MCE family protein n=1 Tax=Pseudonocardia spinosispora TaxID=103441 RepID=UPI00041BCD8F|nr:MCE family protein [Pseudonocardia spinosispora]
MSPDKVRGRTWYTTAIALVVIAAVVIAGIVYFSNRPVGNRYSAMLTTVIGLYPGSDVRVLGVPVGTVDAVTPQGQLVKVDFHVQTKTKVPAGATAAVVSPTVVADRYLQLSPVYTGGPVMAEGTVIPKERTATPAEFDDLLASTQKLSTALGPQGVNDKGALSDALKTLAANLKGNGQALNTTLGNASQAITTLSANRDNLAGTVQNLQSFTTNLKQNDGQVRAFTQQFAQVSGYLSDERKNLGDTLHELSIALGDVAKFIRDNRDEIRTNVDQLSDVLQTVNGERLALEQVLDTAPVGLDGLVNGYNASSGTLDTRLALLPSVLCGLYYLFPPPLQTVVGAVFELVIPGGLAGCANIGNMPTANLLSSPLALPKVPSLQAASKVAPALTALPQVTPPAEQPTEKKKPYQAPKREHTPTLSDLFGGGR